MTTETIVPAVVRARPLSITQLLKRLQEKCRYDQFETARLTGYVTDGRFAYKADPKEIADLLRRHEASQDKQGSGGAGRPVPLEWMKVIMGTVCDLEREPAELVAVEPSRDDIIKSVYRLRSALSEARIDGTVAETILKRFPRAEYRLPLLKDRPVRLVLDGEIVAVIVPLAL